MKVNIGVFAHNAKDWERVESGDYCRPPHEPDWKCVQAGLALGDLAEPLGFDGIWAPEHQGTPYGMTPNPIQTLTYFAGRTQRVNFGTMVAVAPWWNPIRLAHQIAYFGYRIEWTLHDDRTGQGRREIGVRCRRSAARTEPPTLR